MTNCKRFRIGFGTRRKAVRKAEGKESIALRKEPERKERSLVPTTDTGKDVHEVILSQIQEKGLENESRVARLDALIDEVIDLFINKIEPLMMNLANEGDPVVVTVMKEAKETLDEGVYPYFEEFSDQIGDLLED